MVIHARGTPHGSALRTILAIAISLAGTTAWSQPERTGLHRVIAPLRSTFDTLAFFPPAGGAPAGAIGMSRIVRTVVVRLDTLTFPLDEALDILVHHGTCIDTLVHGIGTGGANFRNAVFVDSAAVAIGAGTPPFTGAFSPAHPLSQFSGSEASGLWVLEIFNHTADRMGILEQWGVSVDFSLVTTSTGPAPGGAREFRLSQNYPNPFNPSTAVPYSLPERSTASLALFNTLGELVMSIALGEQEAGPHEVRLDASRLPSGVYIYRLQAGRHRACRTLVVLK